MKRLWMVLALSCSTTMAGELTLVIPQVSKSVEAPADGGPLHARYEAAWTKYEQAIAKVVADVSKALDQEFDKAADAGSLDSADKWDKKKKAFLDTLTVTVEVPDKPKRRVPKKPDADTPPSFEELLEAAQQETDAAFATLKRDYENLVREYTKDRNLDRAKALRDELAGLARKPVKRPTMVELKPEPLKQSEKTRFPAPGTYRVVYTNDYSTVLVITEGNITISRMGYRGKESAPGKQPVISVTRRGNGAAVRYAFAGGGLWHEEWQPTSNGMSIAHWGTGSPLNGPPTERGQATVLNR